MKNIIYAFAALLFVACGTQAPCECEKETNGFGPFEGQSVYLGSQETVDVFNAIDAAWAARDYEAMKSLINDGGNFTFENGTVVTTAQEFVDFVEQDYQQTIADGGEWGLGRRWPAVVVRPWPLRHRPWAVPHFPAP